MLSSGAADRLVQCFLVTHGSTVIEPGNEGVKTIFSGEHVCDVRANPLIPVVVPYSYPANSAPVQTVPV